MKWVVPQYKREQVNQAAKILRNPPSLIGQVDIDQFDPDQKQELKEWLERVTEHSFPVIGQLAFLP